jgi:hypothetical protein
MYWTYGGTAMLASMIPSSVCHQIPLHKGKRKTTKMEHFEMEVGRPRSKVQKPAKLLNKNFSHTNVRFLGRTNVVVI